MSQDKKKMLYLMHVSWYWIKQRPHFLAENLCEYFELTVLYPKSLRLNKQLVKEEKKSYVHSFRLLPLQRFRSLFFYKKLNRFFIASQIKSYLPNQNIIWISDPFMYDLIENDIQKSQILIYDCMDDALEFPGLKMNLNSKKAFIKAERDLLTRANTILVSSQYLKEKLQSRYNLNRNITVINNAISRSFFSGSKYRYDINNPRIRKSIDLLYFGTISTWFDFELILKSLSKFNNIRFILVGPAEVNIPVDDNIIYVGPKKHDELHKYIENSDALIMPFIINDLIRSVNPVKLYEYIHSGKPIITCSYSEIDQFDQFVFRYESEVQFFDLIKSLINNDLVVKSETDRINFLNINTWKERTSEILKILDLDYSYLENGFR